MIRNLKVLGLALVAMLAMSVVVASAAQANSNFTTTNGLYPTIFEGEQGTENVFTTTTGSVKCTTAKFVYRNGETMQEAGINYVIGTNTAASETASLHPEYTGCKAFGVKATVTTTGCNYLFHVTNAASPFTLSTDIACSGTNKITVVPTGVDCTITVGPQTGITGLSAVNAGAGATEDITVTINSGNITYTETGTNCHINGATDNNGSYTGTATIKGYEDTSGTKGAQRGIMIG
jgi:hypothetical protein